MISRDYKQSLQQMYAEQVFQGKLAKYDLIRSFIESKKPQTVLDYGCGVGRYIEAIQKDFNITVDGFDPGVAQYEKYPTGQYDCVICNDVIEHIEPVYLDQTLAAMQDLFTDSAWFIIACYPAKKKLPDGRNAHLTVREPDWWRTVVEKRFDQCNIESWEVYHKLKSKPEVRVVLTK